MKSEFISNNNYKFKYLPFDNGLPAEMIIPQMNNLKVVFSFQNTTAYLLKSNKINSSAQLEVIRSDEPGFYGEHQRPLIKFNLLKYRSDHFKEIL